MGGVLNEEKGERGGTVEAILEIGCCAMGWGVEEVFRGGTSLEVSYVLPQHPHAHTGVPPLNPLLSLSPNR